MKAKQVLLIIGGGIAAYKSLELIRLLRKSDIGVRVILTQAGREFVTPLSLSALSENSVFSDLFDLDDEAQMGHIQLSRSADLVVVAPATADLMAKMAHGLANDLASTCLLATDKPVLMAPAMNVRMWQHAATRRNHQQLLQDGIDFVGPNDGDMACGEFGPGRMAEPDEIFSAICAQFNAGPLSGKKAIVTAGPTHEPIDPVRYLANRSSGKQGYAIAAELAKNGADVTLISGPVNLPCPPGVDKIAVESASEMKTAVKQALPADIAVFAAAVADWRVVDQSGHKLKKNDDGALPVFQLRQNPDILAEVSTLPKSRRPKLVIGFAAETQNLQKNAAAKLARKKCDWLLANDVSGDVMGGNDNQVIFLCEDKSEQWPRMSKQQTARKLAENISDFFMEKP